MTNEIVDLQTRIAFQEDAIHQLNLTVSQLQNQLNTLQLAIKELHLRMQNLTPPEDGSSGHEIPPHY
ncbi:SlyX family protein [Sedimenticola selenatireducens]|uniref:SlyX protein n=1 Tax=Sedimenticola selenatireducens TaxID=191960 RepID=A0A2N6CU02_9GAMM|nr:SlyX family protein [Sedimenticola selenatireducens]PLX60645.1 MAG: SlyX protein [Sedimenticola selenatireducens]